jgi:hypothetical protein
MPSRLATTGPRPRNSTPCSTTRPRVGRVAPAITPNSVDLPAPFGPISA